MPLVITNAGKLRILNLKKNYFGQCVVGLFQNNYVPGPLTGIGNFTEANFNGYARKPLIFLDPPVINAQGKGQMTSQLITWVPTGVLVQNTIFGYFVWNAADQLVVWSERNIAGAIIVGQDLSPFTAIINMTEDTDPA